LGYADEVALISAQLFRHAKAEDKRLIKELFGGPCFEGTLQKLPVPRYQIGGESAFRMKSRGRDN
jgi:hypothetical protein